MKRPSDTRAKPRSVRWTESIAQKVKRKKKVEDNSRKEIWHSVFEPQYVPSIVYTGTVSLLGNGFEASRGSMPLGQVKTLDHKPPMTASDFES